MSARRDLGRLLALDRRRLASVVRAPTAGTLLGVALPALIVAGLAWAAGARAAVPVADAAGGATLGMLVGGVLSQLVYGVLFRSAHAPLLRRLGLDGRALFLHRLTRLLLLGAAAIVLFLLPLVAAGLPVGRAAAAAAGAAVAAVLFGAAGYAAAGRAMARHLPGRGWGCLSLGIWDREVAAAAPLVWAPLAAFLPAAAAGAWIAAGADPGIRLLVVAVLAAPLAAVGARAYAAALPRFGPQVQEFAVEPPPAAATGALAPRAGLSRLLPRGAGLVQARDALVAGRRFAWAQRLVWPVAAGSLFALARWGELPGTRETVSAAATLVLLAQGAAGVGIGRLEAAGRRWVDHSVGFGAGARLLGRWAWGWGASLWLTVPLALGWSWWSGAGGAHWWPLAGVATAALAAAASLAAAAAPRR